MPQIFWTFFPTGVQTLNDTKGASFLDIYFGNDYEQSLFFCLSKKWELTKVVSTISAGSAYPGEKKTFKNFSAWMDWKWLIWLNELVGWVLNRIGHFLFYVDFFF